MVISQELVQEIDGLIADEPLILRVDKAVPRLLLEAAEDIIVLRVELDLVLVEIVEEVVGAQDLGNLDQLVRVAVAVEKWLLPKDHGRKHGAQAPHVQAVIIFLKVHQQLGSLKVSGSDAHIVLGAGVVELCQTPVDET